MADNVRLLIRWAARIQSAFGRQPEPGMHDLFSCLDDLLAQRGRLVDLRTRLVRCRDRDWHAALRRQKTELRFALEDASAFLNGCRRCLLADGEAVKPTLRQLLDEILQIQGEFEELKFDSETGFLSANTLPVTLEGVQLGRFSIRLILNELRASHPAAALRIVALEPNPAARQADVTHPHVRHERLCAGEADAALHQALVEGRLADAFLIVRSVLQTYNADSPHVSLEYWHGESCSECGGAMHSDEANDCESCNSRFCDGCTAYCERCTGTHCGSCMQDCVDCGHSCCPDCLNRCTSCKALSCPRCRVDGLCNDCQTTEENHEPEDDADRRPAGECHEIPGLFAGVPGTDAEAEGSAAGTSPGGRVSFIASVREADREVDSALGGAITVLAG